MTAPRPKAVRSLRLRWGSRNKRKVPWTFRPGRTPQRAYAARQGRREPKQAAGATVGRPFRSYFFAGEPGVPSMRPRRSLRMASNSARLILSLDGLALIHWTKVSYLLP